MHPKGTSFGAPVVRFFACLGVCAYLILNENPNFANTSIVIIFLQMDICSGTILSSRPSRHTLW